MKKFLSILLAVLVLGACGTATMDAKKNVQRKAKAKTTAVSASKIEKDVNDYCASVYDLSQSFPFGSTTCERFFSTQLAKRIDRYERQGKLMPNQKASINQAIQHWENSEPNY